MHVPSLVLVANTSLQVSWRGNWMLNVAVCWQWLHGFFLLGCEKGQRELEGVPGYTERRECNYWLSRASHWGWDMPEWIRGHSWETHVLSLVLVANTSSQVFLRGLDGVLLFTASDHMEACDVGMSPRVSKGWMRYDIQQCLFVQLWIHVQESILLVGSRHTSCSFIIQAQVDKSGEFGAWIT